MAERHEDEATLPATGPPVTGPFPKSLPLTAEAMTRYDLGPVLGKGGMGEVRLARDTRIDREVAVKLMRHELRDTASVARFFREARVQGALEHPSVVPVHDLGIDGEGNPYFVMKKLAGVTLAQVIERGGSGWRDLLNRLVDVALAVELAHQRGVIHRDLKPANIMLGDFGETYVLDWGLARVGEEQGIRHVAPLSGEGMESQTQAGELLGTPGYMAPEQARGETVTTSADVFSLGCILFEILVVKPALPRGMAAIAATLGAESHSPAKRAPDASVPPELDQLCVAATSSDPVQRPTARALADGIRRYLDGDRDLAARKTLAADHIKNALRELALGTDAGRAEAMREAVRGLALDASNPDAHAVFAKLMVAPTTIPAEALEEAERARGRAMTEMVRGVVLPYAALTAVMALLFLFPVRHAWPIVLSMACSATAAGLLSYLSRREVTTRSPSYLVFLGVNILLLFAGSIIMGPFWIAPMFTVGSLCAFLMQPTRYPMWIVVGVHLIPIGLAMTLELIGILPRTFGFETNGIWLKSWVVDLNPTAYMVTFVVGVISQFFNSTTVAVVQRRAQLAAQNQVHSQIWHLRQLDPASASSAARASDSVSGR